MCHGYVLLGPDGGEIPTRWLATLSRAAPVTVDWTQTDTLGLGDELLETKMSGGSPWAAQAAPFSEKDLFPRCVAGRRLSSAPEARLRRGDLLPSA